MSLSLFIEEGEPMDVHNLPEGVEIEEEMCGDGVYTIITK